VAPDLLNRECRIPISRVERLEGESFDSPPGAQAG
jgi:hypothetical protein